MSTSLVRHAAPAAARYPRAHPAVSCRLAACWLLTGALVTGSSGCRDREAEPQRPSRAAAGAQQPQPSGSSGKVGAQLDAGEASGTDGSDASGSSESAIACPAGMALVPGGRFWVGSEPGHGAKDEHPRYETELAPFCLGETEVTTQRFMACVEAGECTVPHSDRFHCNSRGPRIREGRELHPVNCVSHLQAEAYCGWRNARLPSEAEWEYAARGGSQYLDYPWGSDAPDGHTCWKHRGSCPVKSYAAGAFGLYDVTGNLWEWTADWYGPYPWPAVDAWTRVYRGGSWSRRFDKWMRPRLRNRESPKKWGSHLGFRCALTPKGAACPGGRTEDGLGCLHVVLSQECPEGESFNGLRCATEGAPACPPGHEPLAGHGCVVPGAGKPAYDHELDTGSVTRSRSPEFDADCQDFHSGRPRAYRYEGGSHEARNVVGAGQGCKNRDVGVGWNSACCP